MLDRRLEVYRSGGLIAIGIALKRTLLGHADVGGLLIGELGQLCVEVLQLQAGNFFIKNLR